MPRWVRVQYREKTVKERKSVSEPPKYTGTVGERALQRYVVSGGEEQLCRGPAEFQTPLYSVFGESQIIRTTSKYHTMGKVTRDTEPFFAFPFDLLAELRWLEHPLLSFSKSKFSKLLPEGDVAESAAIRCKASRRMLRDMLICKITMKSTNSL